MAINLFFKNCMPLRQMWRNFSLSKIKSDSHIPTENDLKATIIGACGHFGKALAFELKRCSPFGILALYDIKNCRATALDLCHINTKTKINHFHGSNALHYALEGSSVIIISAGIPRFGPNITEEELFSTNAPVVIEIAKACLKYCPSAFIVLATSPINMLVPIVCEITDNAHNQTKVFGMTSLNNMRTRAVLARHSQLDVSFQIPIYGGHCEETIMPFLSQAGSLVQMTKNERKSLASEIRKASTNILQAYRGLGSSAKSSSLAAKSFINSLVKCITENCTVEESAFIYCNVISGINYGVAPFTMNKNGVESTVKPPSNITEEENCEFQQAIAKLKRQVNCAENYIRHNLSQNCKNDVMLNT